MINRLKRLELALSTLPYNPKAVKLSEEQQRVEAIIARLRTDAEETESVGENESDDVKARRRLAAESFVEEAMKHIEEPDEPETEPPVTEKSIEMEFEEENIIEEHAALAKVEQSQLFDCSIQLVNEAHLKLLYQWETSKRTALDLLTIEIEKVQALELRSEQNMGRFDYFCDGTDEHNTSTPKTNCEDNDDDDDGDAVPEAKAEPEAEPEPEPEVEDDDDEDYKPIKKRKRSTLPLSTTTTNTSTPQAKRVRLEYEFDKDPLSQFVTIGPNGTQIRRTVLNGLNWHLSGPAITRKLLCEIFERDTLAYHTLSGKPSPAFKDCARPSKQQLDPKKVADLVHLMTTRLDMTAREVRTAITTKCADENKMLRSRLLRESANKSVSASYRVLAKKYK